MSKKKITNMRALWHYSAADTGEKVFMMKKKKKIKTVLAGRREMNNVLLVYSPNKQA